MIQLEHSENHASGEHQSLTGIGNHNICDAALTFILMRRASWFFSDQPLSFNAWWSTATWALYCGEFYDYENKNIEKQTKQPSEKME